MRLARYFLLALFLLMGLLGLRFAFLSLGPPFVYAKDFIQEYLLAQAVFNGVNPYLPLPELADRFMGSLENPIFPHPTPHPPPVILLSFPLAFFTYETAALIWLGVEFLCISASIYLLLLSLNKKLPIWAVALIIILFIGWWPVWEGLVVGQLMSLLLLLLCIIWRCFQTERWLAGGVVLGLAIALKLIVWPLALVLVFYRQWRALTAAIFTFGLINLAAGLVVSIDTLVYYYTVVGSEVESIYRAHMDNFSIWSLGWRVFEGTGSPLVGGIQAPPALFMPEIAVYSSLLLLSVFLLLVLWACYKANHLDTIFGILVCAAVVANPIAWSHYLILLIIPLAIAGQRLYDLGLPRQQVNWGILIGLLLLLPRFELGRVVDLFVSSDSMINASPTVPFAIGLLTLMPLLAVVLLLHLVWRLNWTERLNPAQRESGE